jgi:hypothetical protein
MLRQHARPSRLPRCFHAPQQAVSEAIAVESTRLLRAHKCRWNNKVIAPPHDSTQRNTPPQYALVCLAGHPQVCPGQRQLRLQRWNRPRPSYWRTQAVVRHPAPSWLEPARERVRLWRVRQVTVRLRSLATGPREPCLLQRRTALFKPVR